MEGSHRVGTDIVSVARIRRLLDSRGLSFTRRWFTEKEIDYCSRMARPEAHFAARLAAKEAVVKAIGMAWEGPIPYKDVEVVRAADSCPAVRLLGRVHDEATKRGIRAMAISLSHCDEFATAFAVAETRADVGVEHLCGHEYG